MLTTSAHQNLSNLYIRHHGWLCGWLGTRLHNPHSAADLAQDTFVQLLSRSAISNEEPIREPRSYLATIARRVMIDHFRRQRLEQAWLGLQQNEPEREEASPETKELILETLCEIDCALARSGIKVRQTFVMSQLEGLSYAEISQRLNVSVSSVKKYMATAVECCLLLKFDALGVLL